VPRFVDGAAFESAVVAVIVVVAAAVAVVAAAVVAAAAVDEGDEADADPSFQVLNPDT